MFFMDMQQPAAGPPTNYLVYVILPPLTFFVAFFIFNFAELNRPVDPWGDQALFCLQVERAGQFKECLGPYSRYAFHHPGPLSFYFAAAAQGLLFFLDHARWLVAQLLINVLFFGAALHIFYRIVEHKSHTLLPALAFPFAVSPLGPPYYT